MARKMIGHGLTGDELTILKEIHRYLGQLPPGSPMPDWFALSITQGHFDQYRAFGQFLLLSPEPEYSFLTRPMYDDFLVEYYKRYGKGTVHDDWVRHSIEYDMDIIEAENGLIIKGESKYFPMDWTADRRRQALVNIRNSLYEKTRKCFGYVPDDRPEVREKYLARMREWRNTELPKYRLD
jgi:hypothetical protein